MRRPAAKAIAGVLPCLVTAACFVSIGRLWPYTMDDAFISLRYARHLAAGDGLAFNPGGPPVEGYTNFLWTVILAVPHGLGCDAELFAKLAGCLLALATVALVMRFAWKLNTALGRGRRMAAAALAGMFLATLPELGFHAVSGMETGLFTLLATGFFLLISFPRGDRRLWTGGVAVNALLLGLARPEGNLVAVVGLIALYVLQPKQHRRALRNAVLLGYVLPGAVYFAWRIWYFGLLLPLPFYLKVVHPDRLLPGLSELRYFLTLLWRQMWPMVALCVFALMGFDRRLVPAVLSAFVLFVFYAFVEHVMGHEARFLVPLLPLVAAVSGLGAGVLIRLTATAKDSWTFRRGRWVGVFALIALPAVYAADNLYRTRELHQQYVLGHAQGFRRAHRPLGRCLREYARQTGQRPLLALGDAGIIPYYCDLPTIDFWGLNDKTIAVSGTRDAQYVMEQEPDIVVLISESRDIYHKNVWREAIFARCTAEGMQLSAVLTFLEGEYYLWVLTRPNSRLGGFVEGWEFSSDHDSGEDRSGEDRGALPPG